MEKVSVTIQQRDLLLLPFPYSDLTGTKVRPALVISNDHFNQFSRDAIVCCVTSNVSKDFYTVKLTERSLETGKLFYECCVKVENVAKIEKQKIIKTIGKINEKTFSEVVEKLQSLFIPSKVR